jgi:hypothetical protein
MTRRKRKIVMRQWMTRKIGKEHIDIRNMTAIQVAGQGLALMPAKKYNSISLIQMTPSVL